MKPQFFLDGQRFGSLLVVARDPNDGRYWIARCDCGRTVSRMTNRFTHARIKTCGRDCPIYTAQLGERSTTHGATRVRETPTYRSWVAMIQRCTNPKRRHFEHYGGRGITICDRWRNSFEAFLADMGPRPHRTSIDRFPDRNGNYEPGNCRWATECEQARNRTNTRLESHEPEQIRWLLSLGYSKAEIARHFGVGWTSVADVASGHTWQAT